jgi:hypothetical protein
MTVCSGLVDEAHVTVDLSLLERAADPSPLLVVALLLCLLGIGLALYAAPAGHRAWSLVTLLAPLAALFGWLASESPLELQLACFSEPTRTSGHLVAIGAGLAALAFLQLSVTLCLRAWKKELQVLWPTMVLCTALGLSGFDGWQRHLLQWDFFHRVERAMPVPNVRPPATPPEAHVGQPLSFKPEVEEAGRETGFLFFRSRVALSDDDRHRWGLDAVALTPTGEGVTQVPLHLVQDLVSVDAELQVRGVRDEGPAWFPLASGNRWEFVAVRGRGGVLEKLRTSLERGKKPLPEPSLTLEVTGEGARDGFHFYQLTESRKGEPPTVSELIRRDGELFRNGARVAYSDGQRCHLGLLEPSWCDCLEDRITHCTVVNGDVGETLLRLFLGAVTLGLTELKGMGDLGRGDEAGLLLTRWTVGGQAHALSPPARIGK